MPRGRQKPANFPCTSHPPRPEMIAGGSNGYMNKTTSDSSDWKVPERLTSVDKDKRLSHSQREKRRRGQYNSHIAELAQCLPLVVPANKKLEKASILRLAVNFLRLQQDFVRNDDHPLRCNEVFPNKAALGTLLEEKFQLKETATLRAIKSVFDFNQDNYALGNSYFFYRSQAEGGFILIVKNNKKQKDCQITYASDGITEKLGHYLVDIIGNSVSSVIHPDDVAIVMEQFTRPRDAAITCRQSSFYVRVKMMTGGNAGEYEVAHFNTTLKTCPPVLTPFHRGLQGDSEYLICIGRLVVDEAIQEFQPPTRLKSDQFLAYHTLCGDLMHLDQRASEVSGFMMHEMWTMPAFHGLPPEDIPLASIHLFCQVHKGQLKGSVFRARNKCNELRYMIVESHQIVDTWTKKPRYTINVHTCVKDPVQGEAALKEYRAQFEAYLAREDPGVLKELEAMINTLGYTHNIHSAHPESFSMSHLISETTGTQLDLDGQEMVLLNGVDSNRHAAASSVAARNPVLSAQLSKSPVVSIQLTQHTDSAPSMLQQEESRFNSQQRNNPEFIPYDVTTHGHDCTSDAMLGNKGAENTSISVGFPSSQISAGLQSPETHPSCSSTTPVLLPSATRRSQAVSAAESNELPCALPSAVDSLAELALSSSGSVPLEMESWELEMAVKDHFSFPHTPDVHLDLEDSIDSHNPAAAEQIDQHLSHLLDTAPGQTGQYLSHILDTAHGQTGQHLSHILDTAHGQTDQHVNHILNTAAGQKDQHLSHILHTSVGQTDPDLSHILHESVGQTDQDLSHTLNTSAGQTDQHLSHILDTAVGQTDQHVNHILNTAAGQKDQDLNHILHASAGQTDQDLNNIMHASVGQTDQDLSHILHTSVGQTDQDLSHILQASVGQTDQDLSHILHASVGQTDQDLSHIPHASVGQTDQDLCHILHASVGQTDQDLSHILQDSVGQTDQDLSHILRASIGQTDQDLIHLLNTSVGQTDHLSHILDTAAAQTGQHLDESVGQRDKHLSRIQDESVGQAHQGLSPNLDTTAVLDCFFMSEDFLTDDFLGLS